MENKSFLHELHTGLPFHELMEKDFASMNPTEQLAFVQTLRAARVSPSDKKKLKTSVAKKLSGKAGKSINTDDALAALGL